MGNRPIRRKQVSLDAMFHIPEGVDELQYEEDEFFVDEDTFDDGTGEDVDFTFEYEGEGDDEEDTNDYTDTPETPQILGIVPPQVIRMGDSGAEVVDVIFEVDDIDEIANYEIRVTKA